MESPVYLSILTAFFFGGGFLVASYSRAISQIGHEKDQAFKNVKKKFGRRKRMNPAMIDGIYGVVAPAKKYEYRVRWLFKTLEFSVIIGIILTVSGLILSYYEFAQLDLVDFVIYVLLLPLGISVSGIIHYLVRM